MPPKCRVLSETRGVMERADTDEIVARLRREDRPIRFFRSIDMLAAPDRSAIAKTVYAMLLADLRLESERQRRSPTHAKGGR